MTPSVEKLHIALPFETESLSRSYDAAAAAVWRSRLSVSDHRRMAELGRWWTVRRAQNLKPATYRCPLCGRPLHAMSEHVLIAPEGDTNRRRHAHTACVAAARRGGWLPSRDEWRSSATSEPGRIGALVRRLRRVL